MNINGYSDFLLIQILCVVTSEIGAITFYCYSQ